MTVSTLLLALSCAASALFLCAAGPRIGQDPPAAAEPAPRQEKAVQVQYLEIVTPDVEATCRTLEELHGVRFGEPVAVLGNARTATLAGGGRLGVRAPMAETETPVVRPYVLVEDIEAAVAAAESAGAEIAHPPLELPGQGTFAIYFRGGVQYGLWQN